jgi:cytidylyltransferase-like protein
MKEISSAALAARTHAAASRIVLAITGGGSRAIAELLEEPGGSRTLLEAVVPYSSAALSQWLGARPEHFCSAQTARAIAMAALLRAQYLMKDESDRPAEGSSQLAGVACTASLVSDRPKRGPHRIHVAWQSFSATVAHSLELVKGHRTRAEEEHLAARLILNAVAEACGLIERLPLELTAEEQVTTTRTLAPAAWQELLLGHVQAVRQAGSSTVAIPPATTGTSLAPRHSPLAPHQAIFPGAFHPLHAAHRRMAELAAKLLDVPVEFEISIENVDKSPLDFTEMEHRAEQFSADQTLWFTRAPTFDRKSELFPGATFIVGADTIQRIADPHYYADDPRSVEGAVERIAHRGGRFLVFGRFVEGQFQTLADLDLPESLRRICREVPPGQFRDDISSTELRRGQDE